MLNRKGKTVILHLFNKDIVVNQAELQGSVSLVGRSDKEVKLGQKAKVIWFTGLPCSGKTTLAVGVEKDRKSVV